MHLHLRLLLQIVAVVAPAVAATAVAATPVIPVAAGLTLGAWADLYLHLLMAAEAAATPVMVAAAVLVPTRLAREPACRLKPCHQVQLQLDWHQALNAPGTTAAPMHNK